MITRQTLESLQLAQHSALSLHPSDVDALAMLLLEHADELIEAAVGYVAMSEQSAFLYDDQTTGG